MTGQELKQKYLNRSMSYKDYVRAMDDIRSYGFNLYAEKYMGTYEITLIFEDHKAGRPMFTNRKEVRDKAVSIRLNEYDLDKLDYICKENGLSRSAAIRMMMDSYIGGETIGA